MEVRASEKYIPLMLSKVAQNCYELFAFWVFFYAFVVICLLFFKINSFKKSFYEHNQSVKRQIDYLSVMIWVQTVCKIYQLATKVAASKERVKTHK